MKVRIEVESTPEACNGYRVDAEMGCQDVRTSVVADINKKQWASIRAGSKKVYNYARRGSAILIDEVMEANDDIYDLYASLIKKHGKSVYKRYGDGYTMSHMLDATVEICN